MTKNHANVLKMQNFRNYKMLVHANNYSLKKLILACRLQNVKENSRFNFLMTKNSAFVLKMQNINKIVVNAKMDSRKKMIPANKLNNYHV